MKGKATITLSNAKTGEIIRRMEEHNIVTNALNNIFNPPHYMLLTGFDYSKLFTKGLPLYKDLLAGIMLIGNSREENPDNFMLDNSTIPVGHAGDAYAGAAPMRGSLNLNETHAIGNGYRFTWDFGTDKANGTIKCIGLTSREFGNAGFQLSDALNGSYTVLPQDIGNISGAPSGAFVHARGQYIGTFEPMIHLFIELDSAGNLVARRYKSIDPAAIMIQTQFDMSDFWEPISETVITSPIRIYFDNRYFLNTDTMTLYYFNLADRKADATMDVAYIGIDIATLEITVNGTVTLPHYAYDCCAVYHDHLFVACAEGLREYGLDGSFVRQFECPYAGSQHLFMYNGCLMQSIINAVRCYTWGEDSCSMYVKHYWLPCYSVDVTAPYAAFSNRYDHSAGNVSVRSTPALGIVSSYMATINNLAQPLVKTPEHTLKITYDITN